MRVMHEPMRVDVTGTGFFSKSKDENSDVLVEQGIEPIESQ